MIFLKYTINKTAGKERHTTCFLLTKFSRSEWLPLLMMSTLLLLLPILMMTLSSKNRSMFLILVSLTSCNGIFLSSRIRWRMGHGYSCQPAKTIFWVSSILSWLGNRIWHIMVHEVPYWPSKEVGVTSLICHESSQTLQCNLEEGRAWFFCQH